MYFKRRKVLSWVSLSEPPDAAETRTRAACLPILPGECSFLSFFLLSFTIQQCYFKTPLNNQSCHSGTGCLQPLCQGGWHRAERPVPKELRGRILWSAGLRLARHGQRHQVFHWQFPTFTVNGWFICLLWQQTWITKETISQKSWSTKSGQEKWWMNMCIIGSSFWFCVTYFLQETLLLLEHVVRKGNIQLEQLDLGLAM